MADFMPPEVKADGTHPKVAQCLAEASQLATGGDVKAAFLFCQSWLIDHQDAVPGRDIAPVYALMGKLSEIQNKPERAQKYYRRAQELDPRIVPSAQPEIRVLPGAGLAQEPEEPTVVAPMPLAAQPPAPRAQPPASRAQPPASRAQPPAPRAQPPAPRAQPTAPKAPPPGQPTPPPMGARQPPPVPPLRDRTPPPPRQAPPEPTQPQPRPETASQLREPSLQELLEPSEPSLPALADPTLEPPLDLAREGTLRTAGFFLRTVAFCVDFGLVFLLTLLMTLFSALLFGDGLKGLATRFSGDLAISLLGFAAMVFLFLVYHGLYARIGGQTLGKILVGIRVIGPDGHSISSLQALRRALGVLLAALPGLGGLLWVGFDSHHRGWHDYLADTYVIKIPPNRSART